MLSDNIFSLLTGENFVDLFQRFLLSVCQDVGSGESQGHRGSYGLAL